MNLEQYLRSIGACVAATEWVGNRTPEQAWAECPRGDWMLWLLEKWGVDCSAVGFWCAERARQSALRVLPPSKGRDALAACAPIVDQDTARAADAAAAAAAAARAVAARAVEVEYLAIADYVRAHYVMPEIEGVDR